MIFGPYVSDNAVPLRAHVDKIAEVPIIILSGSEGALGEWCFALNNGSMPEEPRMLASVLLGDGHHRIAIAHESSLIGKEYLHFAERAYVDAGLQLVATVAIPQVEADKGDAVAALRKRSRTRSFTSDSGMVCGASTMHCRQRIGIRRATRRQPSRWRTSTRTGCVISPAGSASTAMTNATRSARHSSTGSPPATGDGPATSCRACATTSRL